MNIRRNPGAHQFQPKSFNKSIVSSSSRPNMTTLSATSNTRSNMNRTIGFQNGHTNWMTASHTNFPIQPVECYSPMGFIYYTHRTKRKPCLSISFEMQAKLNSMLNFIQSKLQDAWCCFKFLLTSEHDEETEKNLNCLKISKPKIRKFFIDK